MSSHERWGLGDILGALLDAPFKFLGNFVSLPLQTRGRPRSAALRELKDLHNEVSRLYRQSRFSSVNNDDWMASLILEAANESGHKPTYTILRPFVDTTLSLMQAEGLTPPPEVDWGAHFSMQEEVNVGRYLRNQARLFSRTDELIVDWRTKLIIIYAGILGYLPLKLAAINDEERPGPSVSLINVLDNPAEIIERLMATLCDDDLISAELFSPVRDQLIRNLLLYSGIDPDGPEQPHKKTIYATEAKGISTEELIDVYLRGTPFASLFSYPYPFNIPSDIRFEHCHIIGGTGHGKTQLLQSMIVDDLLASEQRPGMLIMDSQGDLIRKLTQLALFDPENPDGLSDQLVIVDPTDIEYPACLNLFDFHLERTDTLSLLEKETILNGTIDLFEYMFGALLGAELTQRQGVMFRYLARLMMVIPGATINTLRELMEDGEPFRPYMQQLDGNAYAFFDTQFFGSHFQSTKKQILARLWGVLSNTTLERMFSHERNRIDISSAMEEGKIIVVNTAKDLLKQDGCQILGRFFIALLGHSVLARSSIPEEKRRPFHVYIDEAQEYFDERIEDLLTQARKYKVGITLAHQTLAQLSPKLSSALATNTSIKYAGGVSHKDATDLARNMHCNSDLLLSVKKRQSSTEFVCFVKNLTSNALTLSLPLGSLESLPQMSEDSRQELTAVNRSKYAEKYSYTKPETQTPPSTPPQKVEPIPVPAEQLPETPPKPQPTAAPPIPKTEESYAAKKPVSETTPTLGRGGPQHTYLQNLIKRIGQEHGFLATIEEPILDGSGQVDVSLTHGKTRVAIEISITTPPAHELANVEKCLAAGFDYIFMLTSERKKLKKLKQHIAGNLDKEHLDKVTFLLPEELTEHLDTIAAQGAGSDDTVRGYKVKVRYQPAGKDAQEKREVVAKIIAQAMKRLKD